VAKFRPAFVLFLLLPSLAHADYFEGGLEALKNGDSDLAIASFDADLKDNPTHTDAYICRATAYLASRYVENRDYDKAIKDYAKAVHLDPQNLWVRNYLGWLLATCPKDGVRDGKRAVKYATKACELTEWKNDAILDTLAAAHAECGDFKEAIKWQEKAIELGISNKKELKKSKQRLKLYEEGKPCRDKRTIHSPSVLISK